MGCDNANTSNEDFLFHILRRDQFSFLKNIKEKLFRVSLCVHLSENDFEKSGRRFGFE